ncbi:hypothetical protein [Undibacterium terreum]|uniref:Solute-binding protein family 3/N-terminal domain-containing protein n=1 Tax=Undibacterium terreum TaxID=1224302 RepID=A0A916U7N7_9BURK|nr:hypothetical protein [Undibacterium terreum]GGC62778.1 hypothetical protein GCM10011396_07190 [Undibacterium terreum]
MMPYRQLLASLMLTLFAPAMADEKISLLYNERIPYFETQLDGDVEGLIGTPAKWAFINAGIPFEWKKSSSSVQLQTIRGNQKQACLVGWHKNAAREKVGKFTHALYLDKRTVALGLATNLKFGTEKSAAELLSNRRAVLMVKEGYSYGHVIDEQIARKNPRMVTAVGENTNMLSMLFYERADYFFVGEEEATELIRRSDYKEKNFKIVYFSDALQEDPRHLWCTGQVSDSVIEKLNAEIDKTRARR